MTDPDRPGAEAGFDAAFAARGGDFTCRPRGPDDAAFLIDCAVACSPLAPLLPPAMLVEQARLHRAAHDGGWPDAMHRILCEDGIAIGHARIAWEVQETHLIDIAVLPTHRGRGGAGQMLAAWLAVADARGLVATLQVQADNPARDLYRRWGFGEVAPDPYAPVVAMRRASAASASAAGTKQDRMT